MISIADLQDGDIVMIQYLRIIDKYRIDPETGEGAYPMGLVKEPARFSACSCERFPDLNSCELRGEHDTEFYLFGNEMGIPARSVEVLHKLQLVPED